MVSKSCAAVRLAIYAVHVVGMSDGSPQEFVETSGALTFIRWQHRTSREFWEFIVEDNPAAARRVRDILEAIPSVRS